jgi:predicted Zn-dependent protease
LITVEGVPQSVTREVGGGGSFLSQHSAAQTFGLGDYAGPVTVRVRWPDGTEQSVEVAPTETYVVVARAR